MEVSLKGRTALITGGSKGLGLAMARRMSEAGANVAILARTARDLERAAEEIGERAPGRVKPLVCDVARKEDLEAAFAGAVDAFGGVDILVNNAGESRSLSFESVSDAMWQEDIDQKLFAAIRLTRLAWPGMKERRWGRIVNVLAIAAKAPRENNMPTAVSRAAGMALTKALSREGGPHNILVNALLVGRIVTDQVARRHPEEEARRQAIEATGRTVPLGRMGTAEEFADIACFLASDRASYLSGTAINVDGGLSPAV